MFGIPLNFLLQKHQGQSEAAAVGLLGGRKQERDLRRPRGRRPSQREFRWRCWEQVRRPLRAAQECQEVGAQAKEPGDPEVRR